MKQVFYGFVIAMIIVFFVYHDKFINKEYQKEFVVYGRWHIEDNEYDNCMKNDNGDYIRIISDDKYKVGDILIVRISKKGR